MGDVRAGRTGIMLEKGAYVAIIMVCCIAGVILISNNLSEVRQKAEPRITSNIGKKIDLPPESGVVGSANIVIAISTNCHFCRESYELYRRILGDPQHELGLVHVYFVSKQPEDQVKRELADNDIKPDAIMAVPSTVQIAGTPTIFLLGSDGIVTDQFVGMIPRERTLDFVKKVNDNCKGCGFGDRF